ncbi:helix-turn-helix domain-containing protein [Dactylosporangium sp. AC04546]|uniref:PucR family transcriptional regulator n=1 Tax=Dactylosporangium sp. AC04546 TaxID=2862460 RepID=UPI001EE14185|nr:helix-turn-helix domain-containing protein [Dactylosporangium sp. AC04546]WVK87987.1 helix-turn-helix domain-containing protein [Dactylosporangium sp. AC04546]
MPPLHDRMAGRVPALTREIVAGIADDVPFYRELPPPALAGPVSESVAAVLGLLVKLLNEPGPLRPGDLTAVVELSARRARDHLPLEAALTAYLIGARAWWRTLTETAAPAELAAAGTRLLDGLSAVMPAVVVAHLQAQEDLHSEDKRARRELLAALLDGRPAAPFAEAARVEVGRRHTVLLLRFDPRPPDRLVQVALDAHTGTPVLADHVGGIALLPGGTDAAALVAGLAEALDTTVLAAAADADAPPRIPAAAAEAGEVLDLVTRLGRRSGVYRLDDVLVEYQLARPGPGLHRLAAKLDPLAGHPYLLETLRSFVQHGHNRSRVAQELHIHRNTLDYRLGRITALTGLDPAVPAEARLLDAALTAADLRRDLGE